MKRNVVGRDIETLLTDWFSIKYTLLVTGLLIYRPNRFKLEYIVEQYPFLNIINFGIGIVP